LVLSLGAMDGIATGRDLLRAAHALGAGPSVLILDDAERIDGLGPALAEIVKNYAVTAFVAGRRSGRLRAALEPVLAAQGGFATVPIPPLSYAEFLRAWSLQDQRVSMELYAACGGLPQSLVIDPRSPDAATFSLLRANSFILTEIIEPASVRNPAQFRALLALVARSGGEALSARAISDAFAADRSTLSPQAALDYLSLCEESGILVRTQTLDLAKGRTIEGADGWYFADSGLRSAFAGTFAKPARAEPARTDLARAEDALAFLRLVDDGWTVRRGRVGSGKRAKEEIRFVCDRDGKRAYVQLVPPTAQAAERLRRHEALLAVRDAWPRYLIGSDSGDNTADGVRTLTVRALVQALLAVRDAWPRYLIGSDSGDGLADGVRTLTVRELVLAGIDGGVK